MESAMPMYNPLLGSASGRAPAEVIENILLLGNKPAIPVSRRNRYAPLGVCRLWRSTAISIAKLWTTVRFTAKGERAPYADYFMAQLSWSKQRPLDIFLSLSSWDNNLKAGEWMVLHAIALQAPRWRSLKAVDWDEQILTHIFRCLPLATRLERLTLLDRFCLGGNIYTANE